MPLPLAVSSSDGRCRSAGASPMCSFNWCPYLWQSPHQMGGVGQLGLVQCGESDVLTSQPC